MPNGGEVVNVEAVVDRLERIDRDLALAYLRARLLSHELDARRAVDRLAELLLEHLSPGGRPSPTRSRGHE